MANGTNTPFGLRVVSSISGGNWTEKTNTYNIFASADGATTYGTSLFTGDPVILNPAAATSLTIAPTIAAYPIDTAVVADNVTPVLGIFVGCEYQSTSNNQGNLVQSAYWPADTAVIAGTEIKAYIIDDPDIICEIQVSTATNVVDDAKFSTDAATDAFFTENFAFGLAAGGANLIPENPATGDVRTGQSAVYLNIVGTTSSARDTVTLPLKVLGFAPSPDNPVFDANGDVNPFLTLRVEINNHIFRVGNLGITPA